MSWQLRTLSGGQEIVDELAGFEARFAPLSALGSDAQSLTSSSDLVVGQHQVGVATPTSWPAVFELSSLDGTNGFKINGEAAYDASGFSVASAGDVNGDGFADLIVGAFDADPNGSNTGASYVVFGKASGFGATLNLSSLDGTNGFQINGEAASDFSGCSVASAGDVNGDGFDDVIVGASGADYNGSRAGVSYVVFGKGSGFGATLELSSLDGANGFQINGEAEGNFCGHSVTSAGDVNGDGFADLIVGAFGAAPNGFYSGASYVVFGKASGFAAMLELSSLDGKNGFQINGEAAYDESGCSVASAGDVNGDGFDDLIVGAYGADPNGNRSGASYVVFGKASGFGATLELSSLDGNNGFQINGEAASDYSGISVASAGDVNGDGFDDLIVGARDADPNGSHSGASYVIFGHATVPIIPPHHASADAVEAMAFLSWAAYRQRSPQNPDGSLSGNLNGSGWHFVSTDKLHLATEDTKHQFYEETFEFPSYSAQLSAFLAYKGDTLAITFRGSDGPGDLVAALSVNQSDYFADFHDFLDAVQAYAIRHQGEFSNVLISGHSLGGAMAEWFASEDANSFAQLGLDVSITTFGSPGTPNSEIAQNTFTDAILNFGNDADYVYTHKGVLKIPERGLVRHGSSVEFSLPNVDPNDRQLSHRYTAHEHDSFLYQRAMLALGESTLGQEYLDSGHARTLIIDALIRASDEAPLDFHTSSKALFILGDSGVTAAGFTDADTIYGGSASDWIDGGIGDDLIWGNDGSDRMVGGSGNDFLNGGKGSDDLDGGAGQDRLVGGAGNDRLTGGSGADQFRYSDVTDSSGSAYDTITDFDASSDKFDVPGVITGIDPAVNSGRDFAHALGAGHFGAHHAVLFRPSAGADAGKTFLVIDGNGVAGYQANGDFVIQLDGASHLASLGAGDFI
jgi:Ca2+-binding RTX toxin-like protein